MRRNSTTRKLYDVDGDGDQEGSVPFTNHIIEFPCRRVPCHSMLFMSEFVRPNGR